MPRATRAPTRMPGRHDARPRTGLLARLPAAGARLRRRLPGVDRLTLVAVAALVVLVTLPRLRSIALRENELDAIRTLQLLAGELSDLRAPEALAAERAPRSVAGLLAGNPALARRLPDVDVLDGGRLRRHGYLFELVTDRDGRPGLRAWPCAHGATGLGAFLFAPGEGLLGNPNEAARFSGPERPPGLDLSDPSGWRSIRLPGTRTESY